MTQEAEAGTLTKLDNNSLYSKVYEIKLLLSYNNNLFFTSPKQVEDYYQNLRVMGLSSPKIIACIFWWIQNKVASMHTFMDEMQIPEPTAYGIRKKLEKAGLLEYIKSIPRGSRRRGPKSKLYGVPGEWAPEDVVKALEKQLDRDPKYRKVVNKLTQLIMDEYLEPDGEASEKKYRTLVKRHASGFGYLELLDEVAQSLHKKGVPVWR